MPTPRRSRSAASRRPRPPRRQDAGVHVQGRRPRGGLVDELRPLPGPGRRLGRPRNSPRTPRDDTPVFSPDGKRLAYLAMAAPAMRRTACDIVFRDWASGRGARPQAAGDAGRTATARPANSSGRPTASHLFARRTTSGTTRCSRSTRRPARPNRPRVGGTVAARSSSRRHASCSACTRSSGRRRSTLPARRGVRRADADQRRERSPADGSASPSSSRSRARRTTPSTAT